MAIAVSRPPVIEVIVKPLFISVLFISSIIDAEIPAPSPAVSNIKVVVPCRIFEIIGSVKENNLTITTVIKKANKGSWYWRVARVCLKPCLSVFIFRESGFNFCVLI